jgi:hypothetical protein
MLRHITIVVILTIFAGVTPVARAVLAAEEPKQQDHAPAALSIVKVERQEDMPTGAPRSKTAAVPPLLDVMAGDTLIITVNRRLAVDTRYEAQFDTKANAGREVQSLRMMAWRAGDTTLAARAPDVDSWQAGELRVAIDEAATPRFSANAWAVRIAPAANAVINDISPTVVQWNGSVKVTGQGFFAPKERIVLRLGEIAVPADRVSPAGDWFSATIPPAAANGNKYDAGVRDVSVTVWNVPAQLSEAARTANKPVQVTIWRAPGRPTEILIVVTTLVTAAAIAGLLYGLYHTLGRRRGLTAALLLDPETQTYSLARAQFFWWTTIIATGYLFLFYGHGLHQGIWNFPPLAGFAYTFMISLGTLLVAQATQAVKGAKGAGAVHPAAADLIVHGGVLAPERVQQVVWSVLAGVAFLWIIYKTYTTSDGLPTIPTEMLTLMGISSAGYVAGKLARKPGPVVQRVDVGSGSVMLRVFGQHLSASPRVLVDNIEVPGGDVSILEPDPDDRDEFARALRVKVPEEVAANTDVWYSRKRVVAIINADTQRADWELEVPKIDDITPGSANHDGLRTISVSGSLIGEGARLILPDGTELPLTPEPGGTRWTATTDKWPSGEVDVVVRNAQKGRSTFRYPPHRPTNGQTVDTGDAHAAAADAKAKAAAPSAAAIAGQAAATNATSAAVTTGADNPERPADDAMHRQADEAAEKPGTASID